MTLEDILKNIPGKKILKNTLIGLALIAGTTTINGCNNKNSTVEISSEYTDSNGRAQFTDSQTGEEVNIYIKDYVTNNPVSDAEVTFIDGNGFEGFGTTKEEYVESFQMFPHNSDHTIKIIPGTYNPDGDGSVPFTIWESIHDENQEESMVTWRTYTDWATNGNDESYAGYDFTRCMTPAQMDAEGKTGSAIIKKGLDYSGNSHLSKGWAKVEQMYDQVQNWIGMLQVLEIIPDYEFDAYDVYEPRGFYAPTLLIGHPIGEEVNDGMDNDCNNSIDDLGNSDNNIGNNGDSTSSCSDEYFCDNFDNGALEHANWEHSQGASVSDGYLSLLETSNNSYVFSKDFTISGDFNLKVLFTPSRDYQIIVQGEGYQARLKNGTASCQMNGINSQDVNVGNGEQELEIRLDSGDSTSMYLNGSKVFEDYECNQSGGNLGINISNGSSTDDLVIDYVSLDD